VCELGRERVQLPRHNIRGSIYIPLDYRSQSIREARLKNLKEVAYLLDLRGGRGARGGLN